ncbi:MAG: AmmeMemoRadiSam system protein B [Parcubacteria group bacterium]|nr:MAG: AmmeMemoRadiSam system protein B [Parcubacteria group bacterium]
MITFASLVPHPPLLIPEIGREHFALLEATVRAYQHLADELYASQPGTVFIISPHATERDRNFTINQSPILRTNFKDFGDLVTNLSFKNDLSLGYKIKESCETSLPLTLVANEVIDYGTAVPLYYLLKNLKETKIVAASVSNLSRHDHVRFGQAVKEIVESSSERIAVIASGDLSHRLHKDSPAGFSVRAQEFDQNIRRLLQENKTAEIINIDESLVREAGECGYRSLLVLLGLIQDFNWQSEELAYQSPFGIGYLTENIILHR